MESKAYSRHFPNNDLPTEYTADIDIGDGNVGTVESFYASGYPRNVRRKSHIFSLPLPQSAVHRYATQISLGCLALLCLFLMVNVWQLSAELARVRVDLDRVGAADLTATAAANTKLNELEARGMRWMKAVGSVAQDANDDEVVPVANVVNGIVEAIRRNDREVHDMSKRVKQGQRQLETDVAGRLSEFEAKLQVLQRPREIGDKILANLPTDQGASNMEELLRTTVDNLSAHIHQDLEQRLSAQERNLVSRVMAMEESVQGLARHLHKDMAEVRAGQGEPAADPAAPTDAASSEAAQ